MSEDSAMPARGRSGIWFLPHTPAAATEEPGDISGLDLHLGGFGFVKLFVTGA